jgi:hypothetical protein
MPGKTFILLFSLVVFAFALGLAALAVSKVVTAIKNGRAARSSRRWPSVSGHIIRARVREGPDGPTSFRPVVEYKYEVDGVKYQGDRLDFDDGEDYASSAAEKIVARYEKGAPVTVYYDPSDPQKSALLQKQVGGGCGALGCVLSLALASAVLIAFGIECLGDLFKK